MTENIYLRLTQEFNRGRLRAVICSGQAVVLHKLAIMSKDGDWVLREDQECLDHLLDVLQSHGAVYRFGAPLDLRWMKGGWSSHFEFREGPLRVRTDFFTRPPRLSDDDLQALWQEQETKNPPFTNLRHLALIKQTNREKDHAIIGEIARGMESAEDQLEFSKSTRDLLLLAWNHPDAAKALAGRRPLLEIALRGNRAELEEALDRERRRQIRENEVRLGHYQDAAISWKAIWPKLAEEIKSMNLKSAHRHLAAAASGLLPETPEGCGS